MNRKLASLLLMILMPALSFAADISIPSLELVTRMYPDDGVFTLQTLGSFEMEVEGGYKFGGKLKLGIEDAVVDDILEENGMPVLSFNAAEVTIRDMFGIPLSASYYTGIIDDFCNGEIFHTYFGTSIIEPKLSGFMYFGDGIDYDGLHSVAGTGISVSTTFGTEWNYTRAYLYQDAYLGSGYFSSDLRSAFNLGDLKLETFFGASFPVSTMGIYRAGFLMYYKASETGSFFAQIGVPRYDPGEDSFNINLFYFLFEPRLSFGIFGLNFSFFWHPAYYHNTATGEEGSIDLLVDFAFGDLETFPVTGGLSPQFTYDANSDTDQFLLKASPYMTVATAGVLWDFKLDVNVLPFDLSTMFEGYIGVRAEF
ncbi:MAG: hypothetical protein PQJ61_02820 [Spirochaetales bacterium]|uniref:DUF3187 family protein n=1 Tax=Candidatus Thalassospirochaeta sargassi TaxID=3119039 RepID=A0AAJ1MMR1_9SPIO|nr:hypothetical protein [Spirochaetales bacterium]